MLTAQQPAAHHYKRRRKPGAAISNEPPIETEGSILKKAIMKEIRETAWGMLVLDEVHVAPASCFQTVVDKVKYHCILGLSATLLREDMGIDKLRYLVGPKLYEANWLELTRAGNLAPVMCAEVRCPLPPAMLRQYLMHLGGFAEGARQALKLEKQRARQGEDDGSDGDANHISSRRMRVDIECINPNKLWCTQALVAFHESRTPPDKTIIFCDSVPAAHYYARKLGIAFMDRSASDTERSHMLKYFQHSPHLNTIILTRVGDIALDLPEATVVIQISGLFASQRQEAQRLGRILRPKPPSLDHGTSFFYSLVSEDTAEVEAAGNRQAWLRDQGYSYRILRCDEIIKYYTDNRKGFVSSSLPADELHRPSAQSPIGAMGNSSPFSRPLVCVGRPTWHYRVPIHVTYAAGRKNGGHVLRLGKRSREDEDGAMTSVRSEGPTTTIRWIWIPFSHSNSLMIEKAFAAGHYNRDPKLHLNKVAPASGDGPSHPPLLLGDGELVPIGSVKRATGCDTEYSALTTFQSCPGTATAPFRDHFHQYLDSTSPGNKALTSNGRKGKKQAELVATAKKLSAAADGSAGYVYFDTSDLPSSHGEWTVSVREGGTIQDANTKAKGSASDITESTPLSQILGVLAPDEQKVPKGKGQQSTVFKLRIRRGRGPLEAPERLDGGGVGHCDLEGECSQEWNESFAFGTSAYDGNTPDEHDCRAEPGSGQPNRIVDRLRVSEKYQRDPLTCVQHFTHVELGKRADGDFQKSSYKKKN
eukprot:GILI01021428.1.p1 GENE.GILI01021428.1~~GILI01021428.1.p1  ORF type:complete len:810 (+),score=128.25 GILI01021428.1:153-2432(+)